MYNAHIRDAAAMCEFFAYFETRVSTYYYSKQLLQTFLLVQEWKCFHRIGRRKNFE